MKNTMIKEGKYNVIFIMSDEQRTDTLGCYGNARAVTPNIDGLSQKGITFDNCFTPYPLCCPARASLWTALMPHRHHVLANWLAIKPEISEGGLIEDFVQEGYHTIYSGKWHVPGTTPEKLGFLSSSAIPAVINGRDRGRYIEPYREYAESMGYELAEGNIENLTLKEVKMKKIGNGEVECGTSEIKIEHYLETWQTDEFIEQLENCPEGKPFFAVCSYNAPHYPMIVPEPYDKTISPENVMLPSNFCKGIDGKPDEVLSSGNFQEVKDLNEEEWRNLIAHYWGFCSLVDQQVGRILTWLKEKGELENTIIVYTSDHGDMMGSHGLNHKGYVLHYDEVVKVPLILNYPDCTQSKRSTNIVSLMDLLPTLADLCGVKSNTDIDGISFVNELCSSSPNKIREHVIIETFEKSTTAKGQHIDPENFNNCFLAANLSIRTKNDKYIFHWHGIDEYYDLIKDTDENNNMILQHEIGERISELQYKMIEEIRAESPVFARSIENRIRQKLS